MATFMSISIMLVVIDTKAKVTFHMATDKIAIYIRDPTVTFWEEAIHNIVFTSIKSTGSGPETSRESGSTSDSCKNKMKMKMADL